MNKLKKAKMNQSDDDIFGRNIDQLDRETPRFNLSEEEDNTTQHGDEPLKKKPQALEKKMSSSSQKAPSIASVQPYSRASTQPPVLSPHPSKKVLLPQPNEALPPAPQPLPTSDPYFNQRPTYSNYTTPSKITNYPAASQAANIPTKKLPRQLSETSVQVHNNHAPSSMPPPPQNIPQQPLAMEGNPSMCGLPISSIPPHQMHCESNTQINPPPYINQKLSAPQGAPPPPVIRVGQPDPPPCASCYCQDCMSTQQLPQQVVINSERQKIEDEILLRQRELDSCWQEDELDCPRDFTAIDRKKEKFYAQRAGHEKFQRCAADVQANHPQVWHQDDPGDAATDALLNRETKTSVDSTSAYPTNVSRKHQVANPPTPAVTMATTVKAKAQAVVSPLPRTSIAQKKVNINTVVSRFSYSNEPENPQDLATVWPQSEMGSRIPSSERINLSPLCMSGVPSGVQTPVEHGTGQKPLPASEIPPTGVTNGVPRATQLTQLPGHQEKKKAGILDKFKGNEQYKRSLSFPHTVVKDSVKDFTSSNWPQSEMGSRIPSSERISLSPLTMSGVPSAVQSGIQTPLEPNTGAIPLKSLLKRPGSEPASPPKSTYSPVEKHDSNDESQTTTTQLENEAQNESDMTRDFSKVPQSELTSRVPSSERICLSPLCQSGIPSGCQTPHEEAEPEPIYNEDGVKLRAPKPKSAADSKLEEVMSRMKIGDSGGVPRFDYVEEDSVKDFSRPEGSSRMQSYENLNFTPPWSSSTSGIVTPSDLTSLYGGVTLRDQPLIEEREEENTNDDVNNERENVEVANEQQSGLEDKHTASDEGPHQPANESCKKVKQTNGGTVGGLHGADNLNSEQDHALQEHSHPIQEHSHPIQEHSHETLKNVDQQPVEVCNNQPPHPQPPHPQTPHPQPPHDINGHHTQRNTQLAPPSSKRRNSWSSVESTSSNRTDISTVVNAPTSMHNTAPASPDPHGSEASDSDISEHENQENDPDMLDSFSQTGSPCLAQKRRVNAVHHQHSQQQYQGQNRWDRHDDRHLMDNGSKPPVNQLPHSDDCYNHHSNMRDGQHGARGGPPPSHPPPSHPPPQEDQVKNLIKMAKEKFVMKSPVQNNCGDVSSGPEPVPRSTQVHMNNRYPPHPQQRMMPPGGGVYYQQQMEKHGGGMYYDPHHGSERYHQQHHENNHANHGNKQMSYHNYQHQNAHPNHHPPKPAVINDVQRAYNSNTIPPMHAHACQPRMQSIPESQAPPMMHKHNCHQGHPDVPKNSHPRPSHQGVAQGSMPYPHTMLNSQPPANHMPPQQFYGSPMNLHPRACAPPPQDEERAQNLYPPPSQQRSYSITSLEPNRHSPPHTEALDTISVVSFASMAASNQNLDTKADMMSSLLSMLGTHDPDDMARTLLAMSSSPDSCAAMRQSGCVPLLIQLLHSQNYDNGRINWGARQRAGLALHNIVHSNDGDRRGKREMRVLRLLEIIRAHSEAILSKDDENYRANRAAPPLRDHGPGPAVAAIMKLSFEEEHKNTICELGGLQTIGEILAVDYMANKECNDPYVIALRKYAGMVLINLTFNDSKNKAVLCSMTNTLKAIIGQLSLTHEEDIIQVFAGIIRNISWRPDEKTQHALQTINAVRALMTCIQSLHAEVCIRAVLSAVWNLSAHNSENKEEICRTTGSLKFLAFALSYCSPSNSLLVVENAGGILRNVSSHIAVNPEYRKILHEEGCLQTLVSQLRSTSTRVVSNACGVLWNLSARCIEDQELLWELGAVSVLKTLINSKHKSISASSASALRNLLAVKPGSSGTDTESHVSFHHRSHSLPSRGSRRTDPKYRSTGREVGKQQQAQTKSRFRSAKNYPNQRGDSKSHYFDVYQEPPVRMTQNIIGGPGGDEENHSAYTDVSPSSSFRKPMVSDAKIHDSNILAHSRVHRMYGSSSSCSSFSPKDKTQYRVPYPTNNFPNTSEIKTNELERDTVCSEKEPPLREVQREENNVVVEEELKTYDDCKKSICKDVVLTYKETPKIANKTYPQQKVSSSSKLSLKFKKPSAFKKSLDSVRSSKDSIIEKSDAEKDKKKTKQETKKENVWIRTKALKQKLLNRSHSSDLAFDKTMGGVSTTNRKSPFDFYSMNNFPDRVASDQCLTATDRHLRDDLLRGTQEGGGSDIHHGNEMHHGSWSSCECKEERIFPANHVEFPIHTPQSIPKHNHDTRHPDSLQQHNENIQHEQLRYHDSGGSPTNQSFYSTHSAQVLHSGTQQPQNDVQQHFYPSQSEMQHYQQYSSMSSNNGTQQSAYVSNQQDTAIHTIQPASEMSSENDKKNGKVKKSSILKNPLKKSSDPNKPKTKRNDKKVKKKSDE